jgi:hypothetical protein
MAALSIVPFVTFFNDWVADPARECYVRADYT